MAALCRRHEWLLMAGSVISHRGPIAAIRQVPQLGQAVINTGDAKTQRLQNVGRRQLTGHPPDTGIRPGADPSEGPLSIGLPVSATRATPAGHPRTATALRAMFCRSGPA